MSDSTLNVNGQNHSVALANLLVKQRRAQYFCPGTSDS